MGEKINFYIPLTPGECRQRLRDAIDQKTPWGVKSHQHQVVGTVDEHRFILQKAHFRGGGLSPTLVGVFHPQNGGTGVEAAFHSSLGAEIVVLVLLQIMGFVVARNGIMVSALVYPLMLAVGLVLILAGRSMAAPEKDFLESFLRDILKQTVGPKQTEPIA